MTMHKLRKTLAALIFIGCISLNPYTACAAESETISTDQSNVQTENNAEESYLARYIPSIVNHYPNYPERNKNGTTKINLYTNYPSSDTSPFSFEMEMAKDTSFQNAKNFETTETSFTLETNDFGKNGGTFFFRARTCDNSSEIPVYSDWSEPVELTFVKINKTNFPGMCKLMKTGKNTYTLNGEEITTFYDQNNDNWLDPKEIDRIWQLKTTYNLVKKNGISKRKPNVTVSSFKGIEYLKKVWSISLAQYDGSSIDVSKNSAVKSISINGFTAKKLTVNAPDATSITLQPNYENPRIKKIDLSKCNRVVDLTAYGNKGTKILKLPTAKINLKVLSLSDYAINSINLNDYKNLQQLYFYSCDFKSVKLDKCKNLHYLYFYFCNKIKKLDITPNTALIGADFYYSDKLTRATVKKPKSAKITWNKGKWWYSTKKYQKEIQNLYHSNAK